MVDKVFLGDLEDNKGQASLKIYEADKLREKCGVFGILSHDPSQQVSKYTYYGLMALQHRGQEAAGISIVNGNGVIHTYKNLGLVAQVLTPEVLKKLWGNVAIGHVRYGTAGSGSVKNAQPYQFESTHTSFALVFNGNIANYEILKRDLEKKGRVFTTNSDTEVIANILGSLMMATDDWIEALKMLTKFLDGSYSLILMTNEGELFGLRDPLGFKPLCFGVLEENGIRYDIIASESCAIDSIGGTFIDDVKPGEVIKLTIYNESVRKQLIKSKRKALCMFEFVYFARPDSVIDGISVEVARRNMGINLAKSFPVESDNAVVVPVPDSGRSASLGYALESGIPYVEGLMKNRYVWRTFITPGQNRRASMVRQKLNPIKSMIKDKDVILIDDSIVRGTTTAFIVKLLKQAGAKKVHLRVACPQVVEPCYMGVDFPTKNELIAGRGQTDDPKNYMENIRKKIGADSLAYQTIEGLIDAIGLPKESLCLACLNGEYPLKNDPRKNSLSKTFTQGRD
ncbi:MAG: amidophosphoribosyltransferase [Promethearchaeota archaeon]